MHAGNSLPSEICQRKDWQAVKDDASFVRRKVGKKALAAPTFLQGLPLSSPGPQPICNSTVLPSQCLHSVQNVQIHFSFLTQGKGGKGRGKLRTKSLLGLEASRGSLQGGGGAFGKRRRRSCPSREGSTV